MEPWVGMEAPWVEEAFEVKEGSEDDALAVIGGTRQESWTLKAAVILPGVTVKIDHVEPEAGC